MKQFLRYQISGMIFVLWIVIFYYSGKSNNVQEFIQCLEESNFLKSEALIAFVTALPIGVIIHQLSVSIKNHIIARMCEELNDFPKEYKIKQLNNENVEDIKYILEKISNLNSFYYVRFDNGFLAPFLAFIVVISLGYKINLIAVIICILIAVLLLCYIPRICREIQEYKKILDRSNKYQSNVKNIKNKLFYYKKFSGE